MKMQYPDKKLKLYRGIKSPDFIHKNQEIHEIFNRGWTDILKYRADGNFIYPEELNKTILEMKRIEPFTRQYFTDRKEIAERYARDNNGTLIEITVSINDILKHFMIEFQNYSKRRKTFEVVYMVRGSDLNKHKKEWNLKVNKYN